MWNREHSVVVKASKEAVWQMWTNPENWPKYDTSITEAAFNGDLAVGVEGKMKASNDKIIEFSITELVENERMTVQVKKFGARVLGIHMVEDAEEGVKITFRVELRGLFAWFHRSSVNKGVGSVVEKMAEAMATTALEVEKAGPKKETAEQSDDAAPEGDDAGTGQTPEAEVPEGVEGDPAENEKRQKDMHDQIEDAAKAEVPEVEKPEPLVEDTDPEDAAADEGAAEDKKEDAPAEDAAEETPSNDAAEEAAPAEENPENDAPKPEAPQKKAAAKSTTKKAAAKPAEPVEEKPAEDAAPEEPAADDAAEEKKDEEK